MSAAALRAAPQTRNIWPCLSIACSDWSSVHYVVGGARGTRQRKHDNDAYLLRIFMGPPWTKTRVSKTHLVAPPRALVHAQPGALGWCGMRGQAGRRLGGRQGRGRLAYGCWRQTHLERLNGTVPDDVCADGRRSATDDDVIVYGDALGPQRLAVV